MLAFLPYLWGMETRFPCYDELPYFGFLPYLWGMETCVETLTCDSFPAFLPYLWGMETSSHRLRWRRFLSVLTVPMRNGNCSDPTWDTSHPHRSYRTYEEWKHFNFPTTYQSASSSYRTYEEWKPVSVSVPLPWRLEFLPYLWGMETKFL